MYIQKQKKISNKLLIMVASSIILVGAGLSYAYFMTDAFRTEAPENTPIAEDEQPLIDDNIADDTDEPRDNSQPIDDEALPHRDQPQESSARIHIPSHQATGDTITVNVAISESWGEQARCTMRLDGPESKTVTSSAFPQASISGCQLRATDLLPGEYRATIHAERNGLRTNTENITLRL